eukprot:4759142-Pleurochrysis_carterae.AAC.1
MPARASCACNASSRTQSQTMTGSGPKKTVKRTITGDRLGVGSSFRPKRPRCLAARLVESPLSSSAVALRSEFGDLFCSSGSCRSAVVAA